MSEPHRARGRPPDRVVVVGAGLAGLRTVQELRSRGYAGELVLVGAERHRPYDRPPLSKAVLAEDPPPDPTLEADWDALAVDLRLGTAATGLAPAATGLAPGGHAYAVRTTGGEIRADAVVLATGALPRTVPAEPGDGVVTLRTREDAARLRDALHPGARVVLVGAGWIGAEVATAAARRGCAVSVLEAGPQPLSGALPAWVGALTAPWYAATGIDLRTGTGVTAVEAGGVRLDDGTRLPADTVVVGIGVRPASGWLAGCGVPLGTGPHLGAVLVGPDLAVAGAPGLWAVGDVAARWSPRYGARVRGEHWDDAFHAPEVVAENLLGGAATYDPVPYVWSEQHGRMVQWAGRATGEPVRRGDPAGAGWSVCWVDRGRLTAVLAVDRPRDLVQGRRLAARGTPVDPVRLADARVAVRDAAAG